MSEERPDRPPTAALVDALRVRRNVAAGAVVGVTVAVAMYLVRVLELFGPFRGTRQYPVVGPEGWFLLLAFVLAATSAMLVATLLTVITAYRLSREL